MPESNEPTGREEVVNVDGHLLHLARRTEFRPCKFVGRLRELAYCETAWRIDVEGHRYALSQEDVPPLHFRLQGPPGVGKNEIVYELARRLGLDLYIFQGHEEVTPEDLAIHLVPDQRGASDGAMPLVLRASSLATAIYRGGLFFFDEINRVPERALSPLASVLDSRQYVESAMTGIRIKAKDEAARRTFRFACALNPGVGARVLPGYLEQRTLPFIEVGHLSLAELCEILAGEFTCSKAYLDAFRQWYQYPESSREHLSIRQAKCLMNFAMRYRTQWGKSSSGWEVSELTSIEVAAKVVLP